MANVRVTVGGVGQKIMSREPGTRVGLQVNTFGIDRIRDGLTGEALVPILTEAIQPAFLQLLAEWPVITGASRDSADVETTEIGAKYARVALQIGGQKLIEDPRNIKHIDYAPYVEFNGTSKTPAGTLTHAMVANQDEMRDYIHDRVSELLRRLTQ
jgi:hypothetical protein